LLWTFICSLFIAAPFFSVDPEFNTEFQDSLIGFRQSSLKMIVDLILLAETLLRVLVKLGALTVLMIWVLASYIYNVIVALLQFLELMEIVMDNGRR
jgi:hypothetical protein